MGLESLKKWLPWQAKIVAKVVLARLPVTYRHWSLLGLFRHGRMDEFSYAWSVLGRHAALMDERKNWFGLELGPGDSILSALLAPAVGSAGLTLLDEEDYAHRNIQRYRAQLEAFANCHPEATLPDYSGAAEFLALLSKANGQYRSQGLSALRQLSSDSFDLVFSQAVLEHVRRHEFDELMRECHRVIKPGGVMSHVVDFRDHLGGGLNNMRISSQLWEQPWFAMRSGFYTNRLRLSEMLAAFVRSGFDVEIRSATRWPAMPMSRSQLAREFEGLSDDDLLVAEAHLVLHPNK